MNCNLLEGQPPRDKKKKGFLLLEQRSINYTAFFFKAH